MAGEDEARGQRHDHQRHVVAPTRAVWAAVEEDGRAQHRERSRERGTGRGETHGSEIRRRPARQRDFEDVERVADRRIVADDRAELDDTALAEGRDGLGKGRVR
jgi:hypothetical protein